jgi:hypothetical protein
MFTYIADDYVEGVGRIYTHAIEGYDHAAEANKLKELSVEEYKQQANEAWDEMIELIHDSHNLLKKSATLLEEHYEEVPGAQFTVEKQMGAVENFLHRVEENTLEVFYLENVGNGLNITLCAEFHGHGRKFKLPWWVMSTLYPLMSEETQQFLSLCYIRTQIASRYRSIQKYRSEIEDWYDWDSEDPGPLVVDLPEVWMAYRY